MADTTQDAGTGGNGNGGNVTLAQVEIHMSEAVQFLEEAAFVLSQVRPTVASGAVYVAEHMTNMQWNRQDPEPFGFKLARDLGALAGIGDQVEAILSRQ